MIKTALITSSVALFSIASLPSLSAMSQNCLIRCKAGCVKVPLGQVSACCKKCVDRCSIKAQEREYDGPLEVLTK